ncbi:MAG: TIGR00159 family protein [Clostridiales bacterium]|nr:TIGR00159 family protein [Clostridiales bacterium]
MDAIITYIKEGFSYVGSQIGMIYYTDVIDILLLSVLLYYVYKFIRDRRAGKLAAGVIVLILVLAVSELLDMYAIKFILQNVFQVGMLALIILFQPELRSALEKMGNEPLKSLKSIGEQRDIVMITKTIDSICEAVSEMSRTKTGALIVIERSTKLGDIIKYGVAIDAQISAHLLRNIFYDKAPLHDGAVIIRDFRICAAGCFLPLSQNENLMKDLGTRHRAAVGMSEISDALVVVVSEETGTISLAFDGNMERGFNVQTLKQAMMSVLQDSGSKPIRQISRKLRKH